MSLLTATGFKKLKRSNMLLNKKKGGAFDIHNNNGFVRPHGLKIKIQPLDQGQIELISKKVKSYSSAENRRFISTVALTLMVTTCLIFLASKAITLL